VARADSTWMEHIIATVKERVDARVGEVFEDCFVNTISSTIERYDDGSAFVLTGDIPAMWLRDSTWQMIPYVHFSGDYPEIAELIGGVLQRQLMYIDMDPYANAFNAEPNGAGHHDDLTEMSPWIWERKYEVDSLSAPLFLAGHLWDRTHEDAHLGGLEKALETVVDVFAREQRHETSDYRFERPGAQVATETLSHGGKGAPVGYTGMTWSGFRPSDDANSYGYNVPGNAFAVVVLRTAARVLEQMNAATGATSSPVISRARDLADQISAGIYEHGVIDHPQWGKVFAYEVDGLGQTLIMDDANMPSLLSLPYIGFLEADDPIYLNTRAMVLSDTNPFHFNGSRAQGIGSPHTPHEYIWPIALAVQALTSTSAHEVDQIIDTLIHTTGGTGLMHESFHKDDDALFTREWFSWANAMFCELVLAYCSLTQSNDISRKEASNG